LNLILSTFGRCRSAKVGRKIALNSSEIRQGRRFGHASYVPRTVHAGNETFGEIGWVKLHDSSLYRKQAAKKPENQPTEGSLTATR
jgi:hypothetical protein